MHTEQYRYHHDEQELQGFLAYENTSQPIPAVIVVHDWSGLNEFASQKAQVLAQMGYIGFAVDMYGKGKIGVTEEEKKALMNPLMQDRKHLRGRINAALTALKLRPEVDKNRIAVIGFCFGGLCALDLARSGAAIRGAISFHGLLMKPESPKTEKIKAKILVLHGYEDPMVKPEAVHQFCQEMTEAEADWQIHMYGGVQHGFTNPNAHDASSGIVFNELAAQRSWVAMGNFLKEIL